MKSMKHENILFLDEIYIRFDLCFVEFLKWMRESNALDEVLDRKAYRQLMRENKD